MLLCVSVRVCISMQAKSNLCLKFVFLHLFIFICIIFFIYYVKIQKSKMKCGINFIITIFILATINHINSASLFLVFVFLSWHIRQKTALLAVTNSLIYHHLQFFFLFPLISVIIAISIVSFILIACD